MKTKAIIFDKDGTLIDFDRFWVTITRHALLDLLGELGREDISPEQVLFALGVEDGVTDITSVFSYGTFAQVGQCVHQYLLTQGCDCPEEQVVNRMQELFHLHLDKGVIAPGCADVRGLLERLQALGLTLAVATTDDPVTTARCLKELGIDDCFALVYTDDGVCPPKPDPFIIHDLCARLSLCPEQVVMVGDSVNDMRFARNGGVRAIGVAKGAKNHATLTRHADAVIGDISHILLVID